MHLQNFIKIHQLVHKILTINEISTSIKGHKSVENERKILFNHPNLHLVNINAHTKFDRNPQINSQDIEHKRRSRAITLLKTDQKITCIRHNMNLVFINAYTKFYQNSSIWSEDIEEKHIVTSIKGHNSVFINEFSPFGIPNHSSLISMSMQSLKKIGHKLL